MVKAAPRPLVELTAALERAALAELGFAYEQFNQSLFDGELRRPVLGFAERGQRLGQWDRESRRLELGLCLLTEHSWTVLLEVLKHEMAHQYVDEVLGVFDESPHGAAFLKICEQRGIDARASGLPKGVEQVGQEVRLLERVSKLLELANRGDQNEAAAAAAAAQRLILKYNLTHKLLSLKSSYGFRHLGEPTGRVSEAERILATILSDYFFVEVIWIPVYRPLEQKRGQVLEILGEHDNLVLAEYVYHTLRATADRLFSAYQRAQGSESRRHRRDFLAGVMLGVRERLSSERSRAQAEGLIWLGDRALREFVKRRYPHTRSIKTEGRPRPAAFRHGREAGRAVELRRPLTRGADRGPRLLPGKRRS